MLSLLVATAGHIVRPAMPLHVGAGLVRRAPPHLISLSAQADPDDRPTSGAPLEDELFPAGKPPADTPIVDPGNAVYLLLLLATANQWARALIFYTVDFKVAPSDEAARLFMNVDVGFGQAEYGLLASIGFAALFSLTSLVAGGFVDRVNTRNLLTGTSVLWSGATVAQGLANSFPALLASRVATSIGQGFTNPSSYTILGRLYPADKRATVNGLYASSVYFGGGLAALSVIIDQQVGWRGLYLGVGALGLLAVGVVQVALPPVPPLVDDSPAMESTALLSIRGTADADADDGRSVEEAAKGGFAETVSVLRELVSEPTVSLLLVASTFRFLAGFTVGVWIVPFYREAFPGSIGAEFALIKAAVNGVAGSLSATGGGVLADRLGARDPRYKLWVPAVGSLLAIPCWLGTLYAPSLELSLGALFLEYAVAECWFGPTVAGLQSAAPPRAMGLTTGVFSGLTFVGNLAPYFIGLAISGGEFELTPLLAWSVPILYAASAVAFVAASQVGQAEREAARDVK